MLTLLGCAALVSAGVNMSAVPSLDGMMDTLRKFEDAAHANGGSRSIAKGYNASADIVMSKLATVSSIFSVEKQYFVVPVFTEVEAPVLTLTNADPPISLTRCTIRTGWQHYETGCDYANVRYGGNTNSPVDATAHVTYVNDGCTAASFLDFPAGSIAMMIVSSTCTYDVQTMNAQNAGAVGVLLSNRDGTAGTPGGRVFDSATWKEGTELPSIFTIGITAAVRSVIMQSAHKLSARVQVHNVITIEHTYNIIATTRMGDLNNIVMVGSHLDSVPEGPGINDNGSGSSLTLQVALELGKLLSTGAAKVQNAIRFAWWGAEEIGLMGSRYYVDNLVEHYPDELAKLACYLNFDMEAGPNFIRYVYDANTAPDPARTPSIPLMNMFIDAWKAQGLSYAMTSMSGGSDFLPFILAGVPSSGLATGASEVKTESQRSQHGGLANAPLDPCYHAPCDTVANIDQTCLTQCGTSLNIVLQQLVQMPAIAGPYKGVKIDHQSLKEKYAANTLKWKAGYQMSCDASAEDAEETDEL
eukprot:TRINITY_DN29882_c0_g1_i1.p1 TRINITY_DN29882_c0_g1~~TRINITY_DN29882_c0_g1_i1.p1  ORF type:complete len:528 (+),score=201.16 TRINITY_DN29882_c0_g1_i1:44-1627(+)